MFKEPYYLCYFLIILYPPKKIYLTLNCDSNKYYDIESMWTSGYGNEGVFHYSNIFRTEAEADDACLHSIF